MKNLKENYLIPTNQIDSYDLLQDEDYDENGSNGVWDLSHDLMADILSIIELKKGECLNDDLWEYIYNSLQNFKDVVIMQYNDEIQ